MPSSDPKKTLMLPMSMRLILEQMEDLENIIDMGEITYYEYYLIILFIIH